jgi:phosphoglycolate phosphatase
MAFKALIFDLDGTIWDSYPCYGAALNSTEKFKNRNTVELLKRGENIVALIKTAEVSRSHFTKLCTEHISELKLFPGVIDGLKQLKKEKVPMGVATNLPQWLVEPILQHTGVSGFFSAYAFAARKPNPSGLQNVLKQLGTSVSKESFFVGDTESDAGAANAAGVLFAWAEYGYGQKPAKYHTIISHFSDVLHL